MRKRDISRLVINEIKQDRKPFIDFFEGLERSTGNVLYKLRYTKSAMYTLCPFHKEKTPSLRIYTINGVYMFKCFGCGKSGDIFNLIGSYHDIPFIVVVRLLTKKIGTNHFVYKRMPFNPNQLTFSLLI